MTTHFVIDCETLGTAPSSKIISIACVAFDTARLTELYDTDIRPHKVQYYAELDTELQTSRTSSESTINWWAQMGGSRAKLYDKTGGKRSLSTVLVELYSFISKHSSEDSTFWAQGSDFDFPLLADAYASHSLLLPWKYNQVRDLRTLIKVLDHTTTMVNEAPHNALSDALYECRVLGELCELWDARGLRIR